jgi:Flp pilus assembly protein TadG
MSRRLWRETSGAEIAEAAVVLPLVFAFIFALLWFGRAYSIFTTMTRAAQEAAAVAASSRCATCSAGTLSADIDARVASVLQPAGLNPAVLDVYPPSPVPTVSCPGSTLGNFQTADKITVYQNALLNAGGSPPECGAVVSFKYQTFSFTLPTVTATPPYVSATHYDLNLHAQVQMRGEQ